MIFSEGAYEIRFERGRDEFVCVWQPKHDRWQTYRRSPKGTWEPQAFELDDEGRCAIIEHFGLDASIFESWTVDNFKSTPPEDLSGTCSDTIVRRQGLLADSKLKLVEANWI